MNKLVILLIAALILGAGCGKPSDPESVKPPDLSGGFKIVSRMPVYGYAQDVVIGDSLLYMAQGEGGLLIVNPVDPEHPVVVSSLSEGVQGYSYKIAKKDSIIYLAAGSFGVTAVSVADPEQPVVTVSNLSMKPARNIHIMGNYLFTAVSESGVKIANIDFPAYPEVRGGMETSGYARDVTTSADSAFLFAACGEMGLSVFNISDFQGGYGTYPLSAWCDTPGYAECVAINGADSVAFLACGVNGLQIVDYSDFSNVHIIGSFDGGGYAKELIYKDQRVYMTAEKGGLQVIDVSNYSKPLLVGKVELEYALGLDMDAKHIYVADEIEGLVIISIPE